MPSVAAAADYYMDAGRENICVKVRSISISLTFIVFDRIWGNGDPGSICSSISVTSNKIVYYTWF